VAFIEQEGGEAAHRGRVMVASGGALRRRQFLKIKGQREGKRWGGFGSMQKGRGNGGIGF
jgi:hypothetical protein